MGQATGISKIQKNVKLENDATDLLRFGHDESDPDFDDLVFKPITDGLGFNQNKKEQKLKPKSMHPMATHTVDTFSSSVANMGNQSLESKNYLDIFSKTIIGTSKEDQSSIEEKDTGGEVLAIGRFKIFLAWMIDVLVIFSLISVTLSVFLLIPGVHYQDLLILVNRAHLTIFAVSFFAVYYVVYFGLLDFFNTPGKFLLNLVVESENKQSPTLLQTFIRAFVSLISFFALGVPLLLDFQGKLSDTIISERR